MRASGGVFAAMFSVVLPSNVPSSNLFFTPKYFTIANSAPSSSNMGVARRLALYASTIVTDVAAIARGTSLNAERGKLPQNQACNRGARGATGTNIRQQNVAASFGVLTSRK